MFFAQKISQTNDKKRYISTQNCEVYYRNKEMENLDRSNQLSGKSQSEFVWRVCRNSAGRYGNSFAGRGHETLKDMLSNKIPVPGWISNYALGSEQWE